MAAHQAPLSLGFSKQEYGAGCHFLPQCMHACSAASVVSDPVRPHRQQPTRLLCPQDSPGKNTGVGCHFLLPGTTIHPSIKGIHSKPFFTKHSLGVTFVSLGTLWIPQWGKRYNTFWNCVLMQLPLCCLPSFTLYHFLRPNHHRANLWNIL